MSALTSTARQRPSAAKVSGLRLLMAFGIGVAAGAVTGTATHYAVRALVPAANSELVVQIIVVEVYASLIAAIAIAFRPVYDSPLALRFTATRDLALALLAWLAIIALSGAVYLALRPVFGGPLDVVRKILTVGSDVKRLHSQPAAVWAIAIPRGCLLAPLFEELFFRGALLQWLRRYLSDFVAIAVAALLFAAMHVYPILMPYAFVFGVITGWIRIRTHSTLNTVFIHVLDNVASLYLSFLLLR